MWHGPSSSSFVLYLYCISTVFVLYTFCISYCIDTVFVAYFYCICSVFLLNLYCIFVPASTSIMWRGPSSSSFPACSYFLVFPSLPPSICTFAFSPSICTLVFILIYLYVWPRITIKIPTFIIPTFIIPKFWYFEWGIGILIGALVF